MQLTPRARAGLIKQYLANATINVDGNILNYLQVKNYTESVLDDISMILRGYSVTVKQRKQP